MQDRNFNDLSLDYCPDDTRCVECGRKLPEENKVDRKIWEFYVEAGYCDEDCCNNKTGVHTVFDLISKWSGFIDIDDNAEEIKAKITKLAFKHTQSGVCVSFPAPDQVLVTGFCEGLDDWPFYGYLLVMPFHIDKFKDAIERADAEGVEAWTETHGCSRCRAFFGVDEEEPYCPVNGACPECKGEGVII